MEIDRIEEEEEADINNNIITDSEQELPNRYNQDIPRVETPLTVETGTRNLTEIRQQISRSLSTRAANIRQYVSAIASNISSEYYEDIVKRVAYMCFITLFILIAIGYAYSQPGTGVRLKWRRSVRKMKRFSKGVFPVFQESTAGFYPILKDIVNVAHVILNHVFD
ncbi:uncharacterized protein LOC126747956 [Anthonomus grandis grandis]|uniref:uncharacterized protein LOC126747956 n=1 Tax=Anthonomus grandis grandis TaxID=2921223 RepID=UPI00216507ED|nr:uncharacterized protein LOC126747956 [Anthonomus grandis grandis]